MADGKIEENEWIGSKQIMIDPQNSIYYKSDNFYYYLAINSQLPKPFYVDLFIEENGVIKNIHASSQLGDRVLIDTTWTDYEPATQWGYNEGWTANAVKFDRRKMTEIRQNDPEANPYSASYIPYDGFELQFSKRQFRLEESKLRIEIRNMIGPEGFETVVFPASSSRKDTKHWHQIDF
ncbi:hypothetical protein [Ekhidna sp.]|uniref:hypothetical protein n=1 Tax=Ekhidna sp. TaxID=2608089 RepID=UPI003515823B